MTKKSNLLMTILMIGVFGLVNTQLGVVGILPFIAEHFQVSISKAGLMVSLFALAAAVSGLILPLLLSRIDRKKVMLLALGAFVLGNIVTAFASNFTIALIAYVLPAIFHPVYCSLAFSVAASSVSKEEAPKAVSKLFVGVSATMVIGVPITSFIASTTSLVMAMLFFAVVNSITFIATFMMIPSMPAKEGLTYGEQLNVLKKIVTWLSIITVILLNGALFGVYSYLAEYLEKITRVSENTVSLMFMVYGVANIIGNLIIGKILTKNAVKMVVAFPFLLGAVYLLLFLLGEFTLPVAMIILVWGILGGFGGIIFQYWITSAAPEAPDFANGLFLSSANLGTTIATTVCGLFISGIGVQYVVLGGLLFLSLGIITIILRVTFSRTQQRDGI
jgi:predicted MFS family arabinose efflux permease